MNSNFNNDKFTGDVMSLSDSDLCDDGTGRDICAPGNGPPVSGNKPIEDRLVANQSADSSSIISDCVSHWWWFLFGVLCCVCCLCWMCIGCLEMNIRGKTFREMINVHGDVSTRREVSNATSTTSSPCVCECECEAQLQVEYNQCDAERIQLPTCGLAVNKRCPQQPVIKLQQCPLRFDKSERLEIQCLALNGVAIDDVFSEYKRRVQRHDMIAQKNLSMIQQFQDGLDGKHPGDCEGL